jgi:hypothetical protein
MKVERLPSALVKAEGKGLARLRPAYLCYLSMMGMQSRLCVLSACPTLA